MKNICVNILFHNKYDHADDKWESKSRCALPLQEIFRIYIY